MNSLVRFGLIEYLCFVEKIAEAVPRPSNGADILQSMENNLNTFGGAKMHTQELRKDFSAGWEKLKNKGEITA